MFIYINYFHTHYFPRRLGRHEENLVVARHRVLLAAVVRSGIDILVHSFFRLCRRPPYSYGPLQDDFGEGVMSCDVTYHAIFRRLTDVKVVLGGLGSNKVVDQDTHIVNGHVLLVRDGQ